MAFVKTAWLDDASPDITADQLNRMEQGIADAHGGQASPPLVTALPANPVNGQEVRFLADDANGVVWRLCYRAFKADGVTPNPSPYKWECIGGPPLASDVSSDEGLAAATTTYAALTTAQQVTIPLAGDYDIGVGARVYPWATSQTLYMSTQLGATAATDADSANSWVVNNGAASISHFGRKTMTVGDVAIAARFRHDSALAQANFSHRWLRVAPVRVG